MSIHWADVIAERLEGSGPHTIATGITPSGPVHIGNMREVMTAEAVYRALLDRGVEARLIYIADNFDRLRRLYPFLPESFKEHIGKPLSQIPCPEGCCASYADHFLNPFLKSMERLGIKPEIYRADLLYKEGRYNEAIKTAFSRKDEIARILKEVSGRAVPEGWSPFDAICSVCGRTNTTRVIGFDLDAETVDYVCSCGSQGTVPMAGGGKLVWRVDWPARWPIFQVTVEPFGKDHATAGGSYDTGKRISEEIYNYPAPFPVVYEWIHLKGVGAMHSSTGIVVTIQEMLDVVPPEVLRYLIIRNKPEKHIEFDPGLPLLSLVDEYDQRKGDERAIELSNVSKSGPFEIPFRHMVTAVQIARGDEEQLFVALERSGYDVVSRREEILARARNVQVWLEKYAPPYVKFQLQEKLPAAINNLSAAERQGLGLLAQRIDEKTATEIHDLVYAVAKEMNLDSKKFFQAVYLAFLGDRQGPKVGWFLASLDRDFVRSRLEAAAGSPD
ncbi:lysine--tRNA ligase [Methanothrix sp.]|uniref:lysine--tRNA ligase n=1 Tax=Methanothrix sp. TaxID=90426 RepID=UPI003C75F311